ncbi:hypothetical protein FPV67DRAFT_1115744 [Lyophyllum atratum]|nr:hypothetical protein FPV67DRAFT_1115744 [Lyophyllum atratum]
MTTLWSPRLAFPQEIIDIIIDELAGDNRALLKCSLVSSCFREPSQKSLFRSLYIHLKPDREATNSLLHRVLESNQYISSFVTSMCFRFYDNSSEEDIELGLSEEVNPMGFCGAPLTLPRLQALKLDALNSYVEWVDVTIPLQTDFLHLMRSPVLACLSIIEIDVPFHLCTVVTQLKYLEIRNPDDNLQYDPPSEMPHPIRPSSNPGYLDVLILRDNVPNSKLFRDFTSHLSLTRLRGFSGTIYHQGDLEFCQQILNLSAATLNSLSLSVDCYPLGEQHPDLRSLLSLEWLEIKLCRLAMNSGSWMADALRTIPPTNNIRTIIIGPDHWDIDITTLKENWAQIDEILARGPHFLPLQRVLVSLPSSQLPLTLPRLYSKGILFEYRRPSDQMRS